MSSHTKLKDNIAREAREIVTYGSTDDINSSVSFKPKYHKEPQHGIIGMSGIRSFKEELVLKSTLSQGNSKIFVTEEK